MKNNVDYTLYLCTDRELMSSNTIEESVEKAIAGGCTVVQLREKNCSSREFYELALRVKEVTSGSGVPLIIDDRVDIAVAAGADGVHVGQSDLPAAEVRKIIGEDKIVGVSASTVGAALKAQQDGADYIGVGAMYATATKTDTRIVSREELAAIREAVTIPIVIIGGINKDTVLNFKGMGVDGIAVVSAIVAQPDVELAAREMYELACEIKR